MVEELVKLQITDDSIAIITINRPDAANALSIQLLDELNKAINLIRESRVDCTILTGAGNKSFCAGADLKERKKMDDQEVIKAVNYIGYTVNQLASLEMPVIAAINGVAFGGGLELSLACDIRIAANHIQLGLTETSLAIIPGAGGTQRLPRLIGSGHAKRLIFSAAKISAKEACEIGLVEAYVEADELMDQVMEMAKMIANNGPIAVKQAKKAINLGMEVDLQAGLAIEQLCYKETIRTDDRLEGLRAFQEKRKPKYKGK